MKHIRMTRKMQSIIDQLREEGFNNEANAVQADFRKAVRVQSNQFIPVK